MESQQPASPLNLTRMAARCGCRCESVSFFKRASGVTDLAQVRYLKAERTGDRSARARHSLDRDHPVRLREPVGRTRRCGAGIRSASRWWSSPRSPRSWRSRRSRADANGGADVPMSTRRSARSSRGRALVERGCWRMLSAGWRSGPRSEQPIARIRMRRIMRRRVYRLRGYVGYQIDLEFEPGETLRRPRRRRSRGLDLRRAGQSSVPEAQARSMSRTNLTVLTTAVPTTSTTARSTHARTRDAGRASTRCASPIRARGAAEPAAADERGSPRLAGAGSARTTSTTGTAAARRCSRWPPGTTACRRICASARDASCRPSSSATTTAASRCSTSASSEGEVIVHRVARRFILRRGQLVRLHRQPGVSRAAASALDSGTVAPAVERATREVPRCAVSSLSDDRRQATARAGGVSGERGAPLRHVARCRCSRASAACWRPA